MCICKMPFSDTYLNVLDLCRLCLASDDNLIPVFDSCLISDQLPDKINVCLAIQIKTEDQVSQKICNGCLTKINSFYDFRSQTTESQKVLQSWLKSNVENQLAVHLVDITETCTEEKVCEVIQNSETGTVKEITDRLKTELSSSDESDSSETDNDSGSNCDSSDLDTEESGESDNSKEHKSLDTLNTSERVSDNASVENGTPGPSSTNDENEQSSIKISTSIKNINNKEEKTTIDCCPICQKKFQSFDEFRKHEEKHSENIQCDVCNKSFMTLKKLSVHSRTHLRKYSCPHCHYGSKSSSNFRIHLMKHNKQYLIQCEDCGKGFYSLSYYREHKAVKHTSEIVVNKCEICNKAFHSKFYLRQHIKVHSPGFVQKTYQCELCGKTFCSWKGVKKHNDTIHKGTKYKCDVCGKEVSCPQSLKNHKKIHSGEKSFVCDICGKGFIALNNLVVHERIHSGERPYKCDECDKSFSQHSTLKVHKRSHSGEKPYQCCRCNRRFITLSHKKKHEKTHKDTFLGN